MGFLTDNGGFSISNLGDPRYDRDAINLRTLQSYVSNISGGTSGGGGHFLTLSGGTVTGNTSFLFQLHGNVILSGTSNTNLYNIFSPLGHIHTISQITGLQDALDTKANLSGATFTAAVFAPTLSSNTFYSSIVSGDTFYSAGTNLETIIGNIAQDYRTIVQPGLNTYTGGTDINPTINISGATLDNITVSGNSLFNSLTASTKIFIGNYTASRVFTAQTQNILANTPFYVTHNLGTKFIKPLIYDESDFTEVIVAFTAQTNDLVIESNQTFTASIIIEG